MSSGPGEREGPTAAGWSEPHVGGRVEGSRKRRGRGDHGDPS